METNKNEQMTLDLFKRNVGPTTKLADSLLKKERLGIEKYNKKALEERNNQWINIRTEFQTNIFENYDVSEAEAGILLMLCTYIRFTKHQNEKNYIKVNDKYAKNADIAKVLKMSSDQFRFYKKKLIDKKVMKEDRYGIYIDKTIATRGHTDDDDSIYKVFIKPIRELYNLFVTPNKPKTAKYVGLFFSMIPYIQKQDNHLVMSEYNEELKTFVYHDYDSLAKALGKKKANLKKAMMEMNDTYKINTGEHLIYESTFMVKPVSQIDKHKVETFRFVMNPKVTFTSTDIQLAKLKIELHGESPLQIDKKKSNVLLFKMKDDELLCLQTDFDYSAVKDGLEYIDTLVENNSYLVFSGGLYIKTEDLKEIKFKKDPEFKVRTDLTSVTDIYPLENQEKTFLDLFFY